MTGLKSFCFSKRVPHWPTPMSRLTFELYQVIMESGEFLIIEHKVLYEYFISEY